MPFGIQGITALGQRVWDCHRAGRSPMPFGIQGITAPDLTAEEIEAVKSASPMPFGIQGITACLCHGPGRTGR